jgi:hypothetical protein
MANNNINNNIIEMAYQNRMALSVMAISAYQAAKIMAYEIIENIINNENNQRSVSKRNMAKSISGGSQQWRNNINQNNGSKSIENNINIESVMAYEMAAWQWQQ